jgi:hypothetical protein
LYQRFLLKTKGVAAMSYPDAQNPYGFDPFLQWRDNCDYYLEDAYVQKAVRVFTGAQADQVEAAARRISPKVSFRWRKLAEAIAAPEKTPLHAALRRPQKPHRPHRPAL